MSSGRLRHTQEQLVLKMFATITANQPITLRALARKFSMNHRTMIENLCKQAAAYGTLSMTGTGRKGSPFVVSIPEAAAFRPTPSQA